MVELRLGVIGYIEEKFDAYAGQALIRDGYRRFEAANPGVPKVIVSNLIELGIPKLAYFEATQNNWRRVGIAPAIVRDLARKYGCEFANVTRQEIIGQSWGDEAERFIESIDALCAIGGSSRVIALTQQARAFNKQIFQYVLPLKS